MKITKTLEYKMHLTLKPSWTEDLSFDSIQNENTVQRQKDVKIYLVIWACW